MKRAKMVNTTVRLLAFGLLLLPSATALMQSTEVPEGFDVPGTTEYLVLGLAVIGLILGIWVVRMIVRFRTLHQDEATLEALETESTPT